MISCMENLLEKAGLPPEAIGYINAHATSTQIGDKAEMLAIQGVFGNCKHTVHISSTKVDVTVINHSYSREQQDTCWEQLEF